jgi:hypothetical protein
MTPLAASISDATIWSITFDDTRSVDYDRNSFIIQATAYFEAKERKKGFIKFATEAMLKKIVTDEVAK